MVTREDISIPIGEVILGGTLSIPEHATGLVVFSHGSGSSRHSPRNRHVARVLREHGLATLLLDLLTPDEEQRDQLDATLRFDIDVLSERLIGVLDTLIATARDRGLPIGLFGGSTGAAAALIAAARRPDMVSAVVSRGGRPDLAGHDLDDVRAPTLLIVGSGDTWVLQLNRAVAKRMVAPHRVAVIPGATHLFEEPGALDEVAQLAARWFVEHLRVPELLAAR